MHEQLRRPGSGGSAGPGSGRGSARRADHASDLVCWSMTSLTRIAHGSPSGATAVAPLSRTECEHGAAQRAEGRALGCQSQASS